MVTLRFLASAKLAFLPGGKYHPCLCFPQGGCISTLNNMTNEDKIKSMLDLVDSVESYTQQAYRDALLLSGRLYRINCISFAIISAAEFKGFQLRQNLCLQTGRIKPCQKHIEDYSTSTVIFFLKSLTICFRVSLSSVSLG